MTLSAKQIDYNSAVVLADEKSHKPGLQGLSGQTVVVKFGGTGLLSPVVKETLINQTIDLVRAGVKVVVVHGGGASASEVLAQRGIPTKKIEGLRVTDAATIDVVVEVYTKINKQLVRDFEAKGAKALAVNPAHNNVFQVKKLELKDPDGKPIDLGWVGDIQQVDLFAVGRSLESGYIPVIAPLGMDNEGNFYNINADHAALAVTAALQANTLVFLTDVPGLLKDVNDPNSRIPNISVETIQDYISQGIVSGGMLPKVQSCIAGIKKGIQRIAIVDGRSPQALANGILNPQESGTLISGNTTNNPVESMCNSSAPETNYKDSGDNDSNYRRGAAPLRPSLATKLQ